MLPALHRERCLHNIPRATSAEDRLVGIFAAVPRVVAALKSLAAARTSNLEPMFNEFHTGDLSGTTTRITVVASFNSGITQNSRSHDSVFFIISFPRGNEAYAEHRVLHNAHAQRRRTPAATIVHDASPDAPLHRLASCPPTV